MASALQTIVQFFESKGMSANAIAGIVGNFQVESGLNSGAANAGEGAIGIGQWEGGRRTALQQFAAAHGTTERDLNAQLAFAWQEMNQRGLVQALNSAGSPSAAADLWDQKFEVSAGTTRGQRESYANQYATSGQIPGGGEAAASGSYSALDSGTAVPTLTAAQKKEALQQGAGDLYSLATAVPELSGLINTAITKGWTATEFQNAVTNSGWYKTHSDTVRTTIALKASDPATYAKNLAAARTHVETIAHQLGVGTGAATPGIALQYLSSGWNDEQLTAYLGNANNHFNWSGKNGGAMGTALNKYQQIANDYGVGVSGATLQWWARRTATGVTTDDEFTKSMQQLAASTYPGLKDQLASGQTTRQLADPYVQQMAQTLELDPNTIKWSQDPLIKRALQTVAPAPATPAGSKPAAPTPPGTTPLWQFEQQLRQDPRWQMTNNAKSATAGMLTQLGTAWGYTK